MLYSEVVEQNLILAKKKKYTMRDAEALVCKSLFKPVAGKTLSMREAIFIVKCSAVYHGTDYASSLIGYDAGFYPIA